MVTEKRKRNIFSDFNVYVKYIKFEDRESGYFIGNCNLGVSLKNTTLRFVPPDNEGYGAKVVILNDNYTEEEFKQFMFDFGDLDDALGYFHGHCDMEINAMNTVFKFFHNKFGEENILIIQKTKPRSKSRIENPMEVKIFMHEETLQ